MTDALFDNQDVNPNLGIAVYAGRRSISVDETLLELLGFGSVKACEEHYPKIWSHCVAEQPPAELDGRALDSIRALQREHQPDILATVTKLYMERSPAIIDALVDAAPGRKRGQCCSAHPEVEQCQRRRHQALRTLPAG